MKKWLRRGELAKALGTTTPTVKYYTSLGLFPVFKKTEHGQFLYDIETLKHRYQRIQELKEKRHTIEEIKDLLQVEHLIKD